MIGLFVSLSLPKLLRATAKTSVHFVGPFHSTDTFLHFDTGEINASEHLVAVLGASFVIFCAGFGALRLIGAPADRGHPEFGFLWVLGSGIVSLLIWIFGLLISGPLLPGGVAIFCLLLFFLGWKISPSRRLILPGLGQLRTIDIFLGTALIIEIAAIFYLSYVHTLGTDGILNWEIKARYAYANNGALPSNYFQDSGRAFSHPTYPLGIPNTVLWFYFWLGDTNQFWAKTIFALFYASGAALLVAIGRQLTGRNTSGFVAAVLLFFVPQMSIDGGSALVGYADFPLSVFYLATIGSLVVACDRDHPRWFGIYAACLAFLPWIKTEGAVLWLIAAGCGTLVILRQKRSLAHFLALAPGGFILLAWHLYLAHMQTASSRDFVSMNLSTLGANFHRLGPISARFVSELANTQIWSVFWLLTVVAAVFFICKYRNLVTALLVTAMVTPIGIYLFSYVFSAWPDYVAHMDLSISRLLMHVAPLGLLMTGIAASESWAKVSAATERRSQLALPAI